MSHNNDDHDNDDHGQDDHDYDDHGHDHDGEGGDEHNYGDGDDYRGGDYDRMILREGEDVSLVCSSEGARPAAVLAWYNGTRYNLVQWHKVFAKCTQCIWNDLVQWHQVQIGIMAPGNLAPGILEQFGIIAPGI